MNDYLLLYLFTRLDVIQNVFGICSVAGGVVLAFAVGSTFVDEQWAERKRVLCALLAIYFGFLLPGALLIPSSKDLAVIVGGKFALDAARNPQAAEMGGLVYDAVLKKLKEAAKE